MNGPFLHPRPGESRVLVSTIDVDRPLHGTLDSNRGGFKILAPPTGQPDALGVRHGEILASGLDLRPDQRTHGERIAVSLGLDLDPGVDENNDPRGRRPRGRACDLRDFLAEDALVWPHVRALLKWGSGATKFEAWVDVLRGSNVSVPADTLRVEFQYRVATPPWAPPPDAPLKLPTWRAYALAAYGGPTRTPTLTEIAQIETPGDSIDLPIPRFASSYTILPVDGSIVSTRQLALGTGYRVSWATSTPLTNVSQHNELQQVQRFNGAEFVRVTNANVQGPAYAFLVFGLAL